MSPLRPLGLYRRFRDKEDGCIKVVQPDAQIEVDGMKIIDPKTGKAPAFHADGIAYDQPGGWLYFHALTAHTMWRVRADELRNESLDSAQIGAKLENLGKTPEPDGMLEGRGGTVYTVAFEGERISAFVSAAHHFKRNARGRSQPRATLWPTLHFQGLPTTSRV